jgi:hypothetical protein
VPMVDSLELLSLLLSLLWFEMEARGSLLHLLLLMKADCFLVVFAGVAMLLFND